MFDLYFAFFFYTLSNCFILLLCLDVLLLLCLVDFVLLLCPVLSSHVFAISFSIKLAICFLDLASVNCIWVHLPFHSFPFLTPFLTVSICLLFTGGGGAGSPPGASVAGSAAQSAAGTQSFLQSSTNMQQDALPCVILTCLVYSIISFYHQYVWRLKTGIYCIEHLL